MDKAIIDDVSLNNYLEKLNCLKEIQQDNINILNSKFNNITNHYKTDNTNKLIELNTVKEENFKILKDDQEKYINVIGNTITKYKQNSYKISNNLEIEKGI